jgi:metallo-beta-lactamase class B
LGFLAVVVSVCASPTLPASPPIGVATASEEDAAWAAMNRALRGTFHASTTEGHRITASYRAVSKGSALVETFTTASGTETLTVFHRDRAGLMLTHYCGQGNQARLRATSATPDKVVFELVDATNVKARQGVIQRLVLTLRDGAFDQESVYLEDGKREATTLHFRKTAPLYEEVANVDGEIRVRSLGHDAWLATHEPFHASNVLVVKMPDGAVVFCSSPFDTVGTRALVTWVQSMLRPSRMVAINTHFHMDGTGGNEAYRAMGVTTYGSDLTQKLLAEKGMNVKDGAAEDFEGTKRRRLLDTRVMAADKTFPAADGLSIAFGGEMVNVIYPGPAHAPDNVLVFFPARGLLFGGCMIKASHSIGYIGHADLHRWEAAVDVARALHPEMVIPGHGPAGGPELFDLTVDVVRSARVTARAARVSGEADP